MLVIFGVTISIGGLTFKLFVGALVVGLVREWVRLVNGFESQFGWRLLWILGGLGYVTFAAWTLLALREEDLASALFPVAIVIATDVGAYFVGRSVGGPKIAPRISPSKTWSGLVGGMALAAIISAIIAHQVADDDGYRTLGIRILVIGGALLAVCAQAGDFLESWMKRRAGVKDSGALIPGHGGLLDRMDGLLAVLFVFGMAMLCGAIYLGSDLSV
jgi:phosphatidate cytidylyltransferase